LSTKQVVILYFPDTTEEGIIELSKILHKTLEGTKYEAIITNRLIESIPIEDFKRIVMEISNG